MSVRKHNSRFDEFTVLWVFLGSAFLGLAFTLHLTLRAAHIAANEAPARTAPTVEEYRAGAVSAMAPFLAVAADMSEEDFATVDRPALGQTVASAQEEMLALIVPSGEQEAHLAFVLALDRWHRAVDDPTVRAGAVTQLHAVLGAYPWIGIAAVDDHEGL